MEGQKKKSALLGADSGLRRPLKQKQNKKNKAIGSSVKGKKTKTGHVNPPSDLRGLQCRRETETPVLRTYNAEYIPAVTHPKLFHLVKKLQRYIVQCSPTTTTFIPPFPVCIKLEPAGDFS